MARNTTLTSGRRGRHLEHSSTALRTAALRLITPIYAAPSRWLISHGRSVACYHENTNASFKPNNYTIASCFMPPYANIPPTTRAQSFAPRSDSLRAAAHVYPDASQSPSRKEDDQIAEGGLPNANNWLATRYSDAGSYHCLQCRENEELKKLHQRQ